MRNPRSFRKPLAIGAPEPATEIPVTPSRMIHFFDPSNPRMRDKVPKIAEQVDVLLGNLEDAIPTERKEAAREGFIEIVKSQELPCEVWTRVNSLDSPWFLDDVMQIVGEVVLEMITRLEGEAQSPSINSGQVK